MEESERMYTEAEIKAAFWVVFHEARELWFGNAMHTEKSWQEFLAALRAAHDRREGA
jgi:hypothetical protein